MSTVNIRESLRHIDDDTYCKYDLLTMYDSCKLSDEDKCCIAKLLADSEDPEVIYQKLSTYFDEDNVDDLVGFTNEIQETDFDRFISETQAELKTRFSNVIYDADHCNFIVSDDEGTCVEIEVRPSDSELGNFEFYLDGCYDSPCIYDTLEAAKYVVVKHICDAMALAKSVVSEIDDDALQYKIYDVTEDDGHVVAHCMIESTNSFNDIKLGKVGGAKIKKMVESLLEDPSYSIDESNKQKLCKYAVIPCDILPGVAVKEFNNSMEINGGISEMSESSDDVQFNKSDRVKEKCAGNCRVGSVIKSDNDMTLVEWDNSDSDDIEWIDNSKIEKFIESAEIHDEIDSLYVDDTSDGHWSWDYDDEELANIYGGDTKYDENPGGLDIDEYNLDESMKGFVRTYCDECGKMNRVEVEFKDFNKPFEDTTYTCSHCGAKNLLTDPHEYNDDGTIKESLSSRYIDKDGYVSISNIANYIVDTFDGDLDDRYACINSLIDSFKDEGKVSTEVIDQFAGGHNLVDKKIDESTTELVEDSEETDDLISAEQEFDSAATSINSSKLPAVYNMVKFNPGDVVVDFGGGKFDNAVNYLKDQDVTLLVYDPYNRSAEHNKDVLRVLKEHGGADAAVNSNVLNVIKEPEARNAVLQNIKKITKKGAPIYITVYEGTGKGNEGPTKSGYQLNRKTSDYIDEISQVFSNVTRKGKLITAINESLNKSLNENLSPEEGDRVRMDHYAKLNNGQEGIVTGRIGELCWVTWDDGTKSKEIKGYLTVIKRDGKVVDESVNPAELTDCPACGDFSFDSKHGKCTKCSYTEELYPVNESSNDSGELEANKMTIMPLAGLNADGFIVVINDAAGEELFKKEYRYGYDASYDRKFAKWAEKDYENSIKYGWKNPVTLKPYVADIIDELCSKYGIDKNSIEFVPGKNIFNGDSVTGDFVDSMKKLVYEAKQIKVFGAKAKKLDEAEEILYVIKDSHGNQLSKPTADDSELWDRVASMEARGRRGLRVVVYTGKDKVTEGIDGWDNRTGVIKRIDKYLYDNPEAIPPKGYIQPGSRAYDDAVSRYGDYVTTPFGNISTDNLMQYARDNKLLNEASYGGAFDVEDDQYFTVDDLNEFADQVCDKLTSKYHEKFDISDGYIEENDIYLEVESDSALAQSTVKLDRRTIRKPSDLMKYVGRMINGLSRTLDKVYSDPEDAIKYAESYKLGNKVTWRGDDYIIIDDETDDMFRLRPVDRFEDSDFENMDEGDPSEDVYLAKFQLKEGLMDEFYKTERYLDIEIPEICNDALVKLSDMTELQIKSLKNQCANFYGYVENILFYMKESLNHSQDKGLEPEFDDDSSLAALGSNISSPTWDITFKCPNIETEDDDMKYIKYSVKAETQEDARDFAKEFIRRQQSNENGLMWKDAKVFSIYVR